MRYSMSGIVQSLCISNITDCLHGMITIRIMRVADFRCCIHRSAVVSRCVRSIGPASDAPLHRNLFAGCLALLSAIVHQLLDKRRCSAQSNPIIGVCFAWLAVDVIQVPGVNPTIYCSPAICTQMLA